MLKNEGLVYAELKPQYAKRDSVEQYDNSEGYPDYVGAKEALADFDHEVTIDQSTLTVEE